MATPIKTKYTGVFYRENISGTKVFYIRYKLNSKTKEEKVGTELEGITATYCNKFRAKRISEIRLGDEAPLVNKEELKRVKMLTVAIAGSCYLDSIKNKSDYKNTVGRYDNHLHKTFGNKLLAEVTEEGVKRFVDKKQKEVSFKTGRVYAPKSINDMTDLLNTIYRYIIDKEKLKIISPLKNIERLNVDNKRQRYLDLDEIEKLYKAVDNRVDKGKAPLKEELTQDLRIFLRLALTTGARVTSVLNIRKKDINLIAQSVTVTDFKNKSTYTGYLSDNCMEVLKNRYQELSPNDCIIGSDVQPKHKSSINKSLQPILDELFNSGLSVDDSQNRVVVHTLRHTFGSQLAINNTPIYTIKTLMNHKTLEMTMRYAKLAPEQGKEAVLKIGF